MRRYNRRRFLLWSAASVLGLMQQSQATVESRRPGRVGLILPTRAPELLPAGSSQHLAGEAARRGAVLAEEEFGQVSEGPGWELEVRLANAPDSRAALRGARRLARVDDVFALIGGFGEEQAAALGEVAEEEGVLFLNIGSSSDELRKQCRPLTFHVEPSSAMYLDALVQALSNRMSGRWHLVYERGPAGESLRARASEAIGRVGTTEALGSTAVGGIADYQHALDDIVDQRPDIVLTLLDWRQQLDFMGYYVTSGIDAVVTGFPSPVAQTRDFLASLVTAAPARLLAPRISSWDAGLELDSSRRLNEHFFARWGVPMDPPAWAAYAAMTTLAIAVEQAGTLEATALAEHLERAASFDLAKAKPLSFRTWDHQLRQPLYVIEVSSDTTNLNALATVRGSVPSGPGLDQGELDMLGNVPADSAGCS